MKSFEFRNSGEGIRCALAGGLFALSLLSSGVARADFVTTYVGSSCQQENSLDSNVTIVGSTIKAVSTGATVHCPIVKSTSGPGISADAIKSVQVNFTFGATRGTANCSSYAWKGQINGTETDANPPYPWGDVQTASLSGTGVTATPLSLPALSATNYWGNWYYADIKCDLPGNASLNSYTVVENGFRQSSPIFSPTSCVASANNTGAYTFAGGNLESREHISSDELFGMNCGFGGRANTELDVMVSLNANFSSRYTTPGVYSTLIHPTGQWPTQDVFLPAFNFDDGTVATLFSVDSPSSGDGRVFGYRLSGDVAVKINAGGPALTPFAKDNTTGNVIAHANTIDLTHLANPAPMALYQTARSGNFTYNIGGFTAGVPHTVRLHFAETYWANAGSRVFNVSINDGSGGTKTNYDIRAAAGAMNRATDLSFVAKAKSDGSYKIALTAVKDNAMISGIEIF